MSFRARVFRTRVRIPKETYSPQIGGVMVSHHDMVSSQNNDTLGGPPLATPLNTGVDSISRCKNSSSTMRHFSEKITKITYVASAGHFLPVKSNLCNHCSDRSCKSGGAFRVGFGPCLGLKLRKFWV